MSNDEKLKEYELLITSFIELHKNHDLESLCNLIEGVREMGILYQDFHEKNVKLLEDLLRISRELLKDSLNYTSDMLWWFIMELYDIVFHQVRMEEYSETCTNLYFELSREVLDDKFHKFYRGGPEYHEYYSTCVYFILMAYYWFEGRKEEFLVLYQKLYPLMQDGSDPLEQPWVNRYKDLLTDIS